MISDDMTLEDIIRFLFNEGFTAEEICDVADQIAEDTEELEPLPATEFSEN